MSPEDGTLRARCDNSRVPFSLHVGLVINNPTRGACASLDVEARDFYVAAANHFGIAGLEALSPIGPWDDAVFVGDELLSFQHAIDELRHRLMQTFSGTRADESCPVPPERVGFLDVRAGLPFGEGGAIANLEAIESVAREAIESGLNVLVIGD